jgi:hypothetical protein
MPLRKQGPGGHTFEQADQKCEQRDIDQLEGVAYEHRDNGEPHVKRVNKEMENQPTEINMMVMFERML